MASTPTHNTEQGGQPSHGGRQPNRLIDETSPYLLQHAHNPVDWYPWGPDAFEKARAEDKPILLSVGYSACHWCHVMERESFEDEDTARLMNELFVSIKVDREERPDVDAIYMEAVQALTQHGGWPMTVFLLPDGTPFYGGTYFPPAPRYGMPSFRQVLEGVANAYRHQRGDVDRTAGQLRQLIQGSASLGGAQEAGQLGPQILAGAERAFARSFDATHGGFARAPKFPQPMNLDLLLRAWRRSGDAHTLEMVQVTLDKMAQGGMYDQLGGGFHRYSVDERWLVPHFEKMLYDNAQLARVYLHAYQATGNAFYRRVCEETLDYVLREMTAPEGGFYSTQDADSEGEEGKFFLWTPAEVTALLGPEDARAFCAYYDVTERGNFEHKNILHTPRPAADVARDLGRSEADLLAVLERARPVLFQAREQRVKPGRDEKVLTSWNGLMLRAFAEAAAVLERDDYRQAAIHNAEFTLDRMLSNPHSILERSPHPHPLPEGEGIKPLPLGVAARSAGEGSSEWRLYRTYKDGRARLNAYLEDYACYADGLVALYETTADTRWLEAARGLAQTMLEQFTDQQGAGFFDTSADHEALLTRPKDLYDNATPSGNSVAADVLLKLAELTDDQSFRAPAEGFLAGMRQVLEQHPSAFGHLLCALDFYLGPVQQIALSGDPAAEDTRALLRVVWQRFLPNKVVAVRAPGEAGEGAARLVPLLADRPQQEGKATAYVCQHYVCQLPVTDPEALAAQLG